MASPDVSGPPPGAVLVDLSQPIRSGMPVYPGLPPTETWWEQTHASTAEDPQVEHTYASTGFRMSDHAGTHVDAPNHVDPADGAAAVDAIPLSDCWGPGLCLDVRDPATGGVTAAVLDAALAASGLPLHPRDVLLLRTGAMERHGGTADYVRTYAGLSEDAARWVIAKGVKAVGVDQPSPDGPSGEIWPAHLLWVEAGVLIYENLAGLEQVSGRRFVFAGFPIRLVGATGAPVRAVAWL